MTTVRQSRRTDDQRAGRGETRLRRDGQAVVNSAAAGIETWADSAVLMIGRPVRFATSNKTTAAEKLRSFGGTVELLKNVTS